MFSSFYKNQKEEQIEETHYDSDEEELTCKICNKLLNNPTTLLCGHNFCIECVVKLIFEREIICPICREKHPQRTKLRKNLAIEKMMDKYK